VAVDAGPYLQNSAGPDRDARNRHRYDRRHGGEGRQRNRALVCAEGQRDEGDLDA
jgi:hypothetical protein